MKREEEEEKGRAERMTVLTLWDSGSSHPYCEEAEGSGGLYLFLRRALAHGGKGYV